MEAKFLSRSSIYKGDYDCLFRTPTNELKTELHYHDFYEIVVYLGNAGIFTINGSEYLVKRGDIVLINMFDSHKLKYNKNTYYERFSISIDPNLLLSFNTASSNLHNIFTPNNNNYPVFHVDNKCLDKYLKVFQQYTKQKPQYGQDIYERALLHQICAYLYSDCFESLRHDEKNAQHIRLIAELIEYINMHLSEDLSLETLARNVNYSVYYTCRIFKNITNYTLTNYIIEKRISKATAYLMSDIPITRAAEMAGFNNYSYFYKTFRKYTGVSPADYKKTHQ